MWLAQPNLLFGTTPIEQLASGRRDVVRWMLTEIASGIGG